MTEHVFHRIQFGAAFADTYLRQMLALVTMLQQQTNKAFKYTGQRRPGMRKPS